MKHTVYYCYLVVANALSVLNIVKEYHYINKTRAAEEEEQTVYRNGVITIIPAWALTSITSINYIVFQASNVCSYRYTSVYIVLKLGRTERKEKKDNIK